MKNVTYGSKEYKKSLNTLKYALIHRYAENRHHPEHFVSGIDGMNLVDIIEMLCDWKASTLRNRSGDIYKSLELNKTRFNISGQLYKILENTLKTYF